MAYIHRSASMPNLRAAFVREEHPWFKAALRLLDCQVLDLEEVRSALVRIVENGDRACKAIGCMRALIRKKPLQRDLLDINEAMRDVIEFTRGEAVKNGVSLESELGKGVAFVKGDRVHLQQVILNLVINAIEAMGSAGEGLRELVIRSSEGDACGFVTVRDSRPAVAPDALERAFDAFYTTKPGGLGLGLLICRAIIETHGGRLWAVVNKTGGATFQFTVGTGGLIDMQSVAAASHTRSKVAELAA